MHAFVWVFAIMLVGLWVTPPVVAAPPASAGPLELMVAPASAGSLELLVAPGSAGLSRLVSGSVPAASVGVVSGSVSAGSVGVVSSSLPLRASAPVPAGAFRRSVGGVALAPVPAGAFRWPLDGVPRVVRRFDPPPQPWLPGHRGVDLAAQTGAQVRAAGAGTVHFAGSVAGRGVVSVTHPNGLRTTYEPLAPTVRAGQAVAAGDQIGTLTAGHAGCPVEACLHWGLRSGEEYLDPLALLGLSRVRLLPLDTPALPSGGGGTPRLSETLAAIARPTSEYPATCSTGAGR